MRSQTAPVSPLVVSGLIACLLACLALPFFLGKYHLHVVSIALIFSIAAVALQLLLGFAGLLSLGQAAFLGVGAYTSALLTTSLKLPFEVTFILAGLLSGLASLILVPIVRLKGTYLGVATLGFTIIVHLIIMNEEWLTHGPLGLMGIPRPSIGPWLLRSPMAAYYLNLAVLVLTCLAVYNLIAGRFGRALAAIMLNEDAAQASGINVTLYKSQAFVVSAVITGFAGALYAHHTQYVTPNDFSLWRSIEILLMVAVGGIGSIAGAVIGAFVVVLLPELLRFALEYRMVIFATLLIVLMGLGQNGLAGLCHSAFLALQRLLKITPRQLLRQEHAE